LRIAVSGRHYRLPRRLKVWLTQPFEADNGGACPLLDVTGISCADAIVSFRGYFGVMAGSLKVIGGFASDIGAAAPIV
jgi:hypothetical protein